MKKILFIYPNITNIAWISSAMPILVGISKYKNFDITYFDTYRYNKILSSYDEKEIQGGFKLGYNLIFKEQLPYENIISDLQKLIDTQSFDLVVITALSIEYEFFIPIWKQIKLPLKTKVIIGGIHSILLPDQVANSGYFDIVCTGQAETIFPVILDKIQDNLSLDGIKGTYYIDKISNNIKIYSSPRLLPSSELWNTNWDFSFLTDEYFIRPFNGKIIRRYDIEIARGCPYNCTYCGNTALKNKFLTNGDTVANFLTKRPFDSTFEHFRKMVNDYNIDIFQFTDECFLSHPIKWIDDFMTRYAIECGKPFILQTRAETVTEEKIKLIEKHNIPFQVSIGVESGSDYILNTICNRKCSSNQIINAFNILHKYNIRTNAFFMIGLPFETREDYFKTVELYRTIKPSVSSVAIFQPMPGQQLTNLCIKNQFISGNETLLGFTDKSPLNMPSPYLNNTEIKNLWRTFVLYSTLPKKYYPDIKKCENDYDNNIDLFNRLINLRWKYDYSNFRNEKKLI